eukprot:COSAG05_NODE_371_length_10705_cov_99.051475_4_plen_85_part_00
MPILQIQEFQEIQEIPATCIRIFSSVHIHFSKLGRGFLCRETPVWGRAARRKEEEEAQAKAAEEARVRAEKRAALAARAAMFNN